MVNGEIVHISDNAVHLGHNISTSDRDSMILAAKRAFWKSYNNFASNFGHLSGASTGFGRGGAKNFFFQIWEFACREATCCAWRSHAHC